MADSHPVTWANFLADPQTALNAVYSGLTLIIAAAAIAQLVIFRHFTQRQIRAYLHADTISLSDGSTAAPLFPNRANTPWVYIEVKNSGATPAYDVIHWAKTEVRLSSEESLLIAPARLSETSKTHMPREGRISKGIWYDRALSNQEISEISLGNRTIFVYGVVEYSDAFGKRHRTEYKLKYIGSYPPPVPPGTLSFCDSGNSAS